MKIKIRHALTSVSNNVSLLHNVSISSVNVVKVHKEIKNKRYIVRHEDWKVFDEITQMVSAYSIVDGSYIGDLKTAQRLDEMGITPERAKPDHNVASIGISDIDGKHYGWSHRAIWGFKPGDAIKKGDCAYLPKPNAQSILDSVRSFWSEPGHIIELENNNVVHWSPNYDKLRERFGNDFFQWSDQEFGAEFGRQSVQTVWLKLRHDGYMIKDVTPISKIATGKGEYIIQNMMDAKRAATDFAISVSKTVNIC